MSETNSERFVPLGELHEHPANHHLDWQLQLPEYTGAENLYCDVQAINRIARLGTLVTFTVQPGRQQKEDHPAIGGMSGEGTATGAASLNFLRRKRRPPVDLDCIHNEKGEHLPYVSNATVEIDIDTISQRLSDKGQLRNTERWATELNKVTASGLRRAALKNTAWNLLPSGLTGLIGSIPGTFLFGGLTYGFAESVHHPLSIKNALYIGGLITAGVVTYSMLELMQEDGDKYGIPRKELPYSVTPFGVDRMTLIAASSLRHRKLIRHMPELAKDEA